MKIPLLTVVLVVSLLGAGCSRKTEWTKQEVIDWYSENEGMIRPAWRALFYRGSDSTKHYFLTRVMDEFVFFEIPRAELSVPEEHPHPAASDAPMYCYRVDPKDGFVQIKEGA